MTRDEIYDHLAQVYLGKCDRNDDSQKRQLYVWRVMNIVITVVILASSFYGLTAFLTHRGSQWENDVIFTLNNGPIRIKYELNNPYPPVKTFSLILPNMNVLKYNKINFSIRALEDGAPGVVKIVLENRKKEIAMHFVKDVYLEWQNVSIPLDKLSGITDWTNVTKVSFVLESWNVEKKKGLILIDNVCFSS